MCLLKLKKEVQILKPYFPPSGITPASLISWIGTMTSFPQPGSVTLCEINRELINVDNFSTDRAKETYGKITGTVFSPIPFQSETLLVEQLDEQPSQQMKDVIISAALDSLLFSLFLKYFFQPTDVKLLQDIDLHLLSWNQYKHLLAFVSGPHQVTVHDYDDVEGKDPCILINESQKNVKGLDWRPNGGKVLSVASKGGICLWSGCDPGNPASVRSGSTSNTFSRASGSRWMLVDFLPSLHDEQISSLSWSPDGRFLASASFENSSFTVWDVSQGKGTPVRRGLGGISLLKWSPSGDYFFASKFDGTFYLWQTSTWTSELWSSTIGFVTGATWDPEGRMILLAFSDSTTLGSLHFASKPPSLDAHLVPVELPEVKSLTGSKGIEKIAWDASGERLAVSYKDGDDLFRGLVAIYDVKRSPLVSPSLIGFIRGPGDNPKPTAISFQSQDKHGPLLSVCWSSGFCCTYPLIFR